MQTPTIIYQHYTYIYYDPDTLQPFLVGKGSDERYKFHLTCSLKASHNPHKFYKIRKIHNSGKETIIKLLYKETEDEAYDLEDFLSHHWELEKFGGLLVNLVYGGRGGQKGIKHTEEQNKKNGETHSKTYQITYPNGEIKIIINLNAFCRENNLQHGAMCLVSQGKHKQHKGFKCSKIS